MRGEDAHAIAASPDCPRCGSEPLDVFQPHPLRPALILGLCWGCGELYRLEPRRDGRGFGVAEGPLVARGDGDGDCRCRTAPGR